MSKNALPSCVRILRLKDFRKTLDRPKSSAVTKVAFAMIFIARKRDKVQICQFYGSGRSMPEAGRMAFQYELERVDSEFRLRVPLVGFHPFVR